MIYLMHLLVLHRIDIPLQRIAIIYAHPFRYAFSGFALTLIVCVVWAVLVKKIGPRIGRLLGA